ncbi:MAG: amidohydrolase family protein, partial [Burkholderiaceae bacterium]
DRSRGERLPLEWVVHKQTAEPASLFGFADRGCIAPGFKADINLIDYDRLHIHAPEMAYDLPAGGRRLLQRATGYVATLVSGAPIIEDGVATGERPGRLIRGGR